MYRFKNGESHPSVSYQIIAVLDTETTTEKLPSRLTLSLSMSNPLSNNSPRKSRSLTVSTLNRNSIGSRIIHNSRSRAITSHSGRNTTNTRLTARRTGSTISSRRRCHTSRTSRISYTIVAYSISGSETDCVDFIGRGTGAVVVGCRAGCRGVLSFILNGLGV